MPAPGPIAVWWADLDGALPADWPTLLSPDEIAAAEARHRPRDRRHALLTRYFVRRALAAHLGHAARLLAFRREPGGKPRLVVPRGDAVEFSLSHSGALAVLAIARRPVGIDVERLDPLVPLREMAERHMPPASWAALQRLPADAVGPAFLRFWVRREAMAKVFGAGIDGREATPPLRVDDLAAPPDHRAAIAAAGTDPIAVVARSWVPASEDAG
jgi:4'-phosphopantetheinyl transferase